MKNNNTFEIESCDCGRSYWKIYRNGRKECCCAYCKGKYMMDEMYFPTHEMEDLGIDHEKVYGIDDEDREDFYCWFAEKGYVIAENICAAKYTAYHPSLEMLHAKSKTEKKLHEMLITRDSAEHDWNTSYREEIYRRIVNNARQPFYEEYAPAIVDLVWYYTREELAHARAAMEDMDDLPGDDELLLTNIYASVTKPQFADVRLIADDPSVKKCLEHTIRYYNDYDGICQEAMRFKMDVLLPIQLEVEHMDHLLADMYREIEKKYRDHAIEYYDQLFYEIWSAYWLHDTESMYSEDNGEWFPDDAGDYILYDIK